MPRKARPKRAKPKKAKPISSAEYDGPDADAFFEALDEQEALEADRPAAIPYRRPGRILLPESNGCVRGSEESEEAFMQRVCANAPWLEEMVLLHWHNATTKQARDSAERQLRQLEHEGRGPTIRRLQDDMRERVENLRAEAAGGAGTLSASGESPGGKAQGATQSVDVRDGMNGKELFRLYGHLLQGKSKYKALWKVLDAHPEIRRHKLSGVLWIHRGDWGEYVRKLEQTQKAGAAAVVKKGLWRCPKCRKTFFDKPDLVLCPQCQCDLEPVTSPPPK